MLLRDNLKDIQVTKYYVKEKIYNIPLIEVVRYTGILVVVGDEVVDSGCVCQEVVFSFRVLYRLVVVKIVLGVVVVVLLVDG
jgi:hypothetical protein